MPLKTLKKRKKIRTRKHFNPIIKPCNSGHLQSHFLLLKMEIKHLLKTSARVLSIFLSIQQVQQIRAIAADTTRKTHAILVFGDSIVDPGNNNAIFTMVKCNFPPYGQNFPNHLATERFSNGQILCDIIGKMLLYI
jgi:hypothetical protein